MRNEAIALFKQSAKDFESAKKIFEYAEAWYLVVFLCHQSIEKGLKAVSMIKKNRDQKSHSLIFLAKEAGMPEKFHSFLRELTPEYISTRYPEAGNDAPFELYDKEIAKRFLEKTEPVIEWIQQQKK